MITSLEIFAERHEALLKRVKVSPTSRESLAIWKSSTPDPERLLDRWLDGLKLPHDSAIALSGVGDGSHIRAILKRMPESGLLFCSEPKVERFKAFLEMVGSDELLRDTRVAFGVGELDEAYFQSLSTFEVMNFENAEPIVFAPLFQEDENYYSTFFKEFAQRLEVSRKLYGTNLTKSGLWQGNTLRNLPVLVRSPDPAEFAGIFAGVPMIMAGAGPSLDESIDFLLWAQDRAVIVAGNSSIRALVNGGVRPHFVLAADPNPTTDAGFEGVDLGETILVCPFLVHPGVPNRFQRRATAWSRGNLAARYFREASGVKRFAHVTEQGTVSACAFDLAVILGSPSLMFVGQDLAARTDGQMHASDSIYHDQGSDQTNLDRCRWWPGNTLERVPVEEKLFVYLKTFEQLSYIYSKEVKLKNGKGLDVYNLSRLGAKIENMPYLDFGQAEALIEKTSEDSNLAAGWKKAQSVLNAYDVGWGRVGKAIREFRDYVEGICSFALKQALAQELETADAKDALAAKAELSRRVEKHPEFAKILNDGQFKMELYVHNRTRALRARKRFDDSEEELFDTIKNYFWAVAEGSFHVLSALDESRRENR